MLVQLGHAGESQTLFELCWLSDCGRGFLRLACYTLQCATALPVIHSHRLGRMQHAQGRVEQLMRRSVMEFSHMGHVLQLKFQKKVGMLWKL